MQKKFLVENTLNQINSFSSSKYEENDFLQFKLRSRKILV